MEIWDIYYASLVAMTLHPGYNRPDTRKPTLEHCAKIADQMVEIAEKRKCQLHQL